MVHFIRAPLIKANSKERDNSLNTAAISRKPCPFIKENGLMESLTVRENNLYSIA